MVVTSAMLAAILKNQLFFVSGGCQYFPNRKRSAHAIRFPKTQLLLLLRLQWMTSFVGEAEVDDHLLLLVRNQGPRSKFKIGLEGGGGISASILGGGGAQNTFCY